MEDFERIKNKVSPIINEFNKLCITNNYNKMEENIKVLRDNHGELIKIYDNIKKSQDYKTISKIYSFINHLDDIIKRFESTHNTISKLNNIFQNLTKKEEPSKDESATEITIPLEEEKEEEEEKEQTGKQTQPPLMMSGGGIRKYKDPQIILFRSKNCNKCNNFERRTIPKIKEEFGNSIHIKKIDCDKYKEKCKSMNIQKHPTILFLYKGIKTKYEKGDIIDFIKKNM